jgi:hypothetical protein
LGQPVAEPAVSLDLGEPESSGFATCEMHVDVGNKELPVQAAPVHGTIAGELPGANKTDSLMHAQSMAYAKDTAYAQGWHLDEKGQPNWWPTVEAFAYAIGVWARAQLRAGMDIAPCTIYDEDVVPIDNENFPPKHEWLNESTVNEMQSNNNAAPWLRLQMLLYPFTPTLDLSDDKSPQSVVASLLASTAKEVFPALAASAVRMAVSKLLSAQVPYQLLSAAPSLGCGALSGALNRVYTGPW